MSLKPKVSLKKIEQTIDLEQLFGVDLSEDDTLAKGLGQVLIDKMLTRTESGKGYGGGELYKPYSKEYANSLPFKAAGKSKNKINMNLTGDMLASLDVDVDGSKITLFIDGGEVPKAFNHITGDTVPKRNFFGFSSSELKEIKKEFKPKIKEALAKGPDGVDLFLSQALDQLDEES